MNKAGFYGRVEQMLAAGRTLRFCLVVENHGSSPGRAGFAMAMDERGDFFGSIGGGSMEHDILEEMKGDGFQTGYRHLRHSTDGAADSTGMLCSGDQGLIFCELNEAHLNTFRELRQAFSSHVPGCLHIHSSGQLRFETETVSGPRIRFSRTDQDWDYHERMGAVDPVAIIGAGHVGQALCRILKSLDFYCILLDDRPDMIAGAENDGSAHESRVVNYDRIADETGFPDADLSVVIMTHNHSGDEKVLARFAGRPFRYLGMMGSPAKVARVYKNLRDNGIRKEDLEAVHAPIGVPIFSETPEEIAVSISAELIRVRHESERR